MAPKPSRSRHRPVPAVPYPSKANLPTSPGVSSVEGDIEHPLGAHEDHRASSINKDESVLRTSQGDTFTRRRSMTLYRVHSNGEGAAHSESGDLSHSREKLSELGEMSASREDIGTPSQEKKVPQSEPPRQESVTVSHARYTEGENKPHQQKAGSSTNQPAITSNVSSSSHRKSHGRAPGLKTLYGGGITEIALPPMANGRESASAPENSHLSGPVSKESVPSQNKQLSIEPTPTKRRSEENETGSTTSTTTRKDDAKFEEVELPKMHRASIDWRKKLMVIKGSDDRLNSVDEDVMMQHYSSRFFSDEKKLMSPTDGTIYLDFDHLGKTENEDSKEQDWSNNLKQDPDTGPGIIQISTRKGTSFERKQMLRFVLSLAASLVAAVMVTLYLYLRYTFILEVVNAMPQKYTASWLLLAVETIVWISLGVASVYDVLSHAPSRGPHVSSLRIRSETNLPIVDILIITSGYSDDIVIDTVAAALALDYPPSRYRVMVIDNSGSPNLQRRIDLFKTRPMNLSYHKVPYDHFIKHRCHPSGYAVQFALQQRTPRTPSPYVAILDGDMIPELGFLRALVPHIAHDAAIGLVACPMTYYDLPKSLDGPTASLLEMTGTLVQPRETTLQGIRSGILLRRSAIKDIGGFPVFSCIDDGAVVPLLAQKGYRSIMVKEPVQCGTATPFDFVAATSHAAALRIGSFRLAVFRGSLGARLFNLMLPTCRMIFSFLFCCCIISIPIQFFSSTVLVPVLRISQLAGLIQMSFLMLFSFGLRDSLWCTRSSTPTFRRRLQTWAFVAPYDMITFLNQIFPLKSRSNVQQLRAGSSPSRLARLGRTTTTGFAWLHLSLAITIAASVGYTIAMLIINRRAMSPYQAGLLALIGGAFWPTLVFLDIWLGLLVPFSIALKPKAIPLREDLLIRDPFTMVARPKLSARTYYPFVVAHSPVECVISLIFCSYSLLLLALSFIKTRD